MLPAAAAPPPSFFLYGEPPHAADPDFLHLEPLDARSRPAHWTIAPHRHEDLSHLFLLTGGGGTMEAEGRRLVFDAPALLLLPAKAVHGFAFRRESSGQVLTLSSDYLAGRVGRSAPELEALFAEPQAIGCGEAAAPLQEVFGRLARELTWQAPGHQAAVEACVLQALVLVLRQRHHALPRRPGEAARDSALVARFREQVELRFRRHEPLEAYAQALAVSLSRLRQACRRAAGASPLELIQARRLLEARRALLYSDLPITEVALSLGFEDVAYFSRVFSRSAKVSPRQFRRERGATVRASASSG